MAIPSDYYSALLWLRDHTPQRSVVAEPGGLTIRAALPTTWIAERRAWLPTPYTEATLAAPVGSSIPQRSVHWSAFMHEPGNAAAARAIASEADYLVVPRSIQSPFWTPVQRSGSWTIYQSAVPDHAAE